MSRKWMIAWIIIIGAAAPLLYQVSPIRAQEPTAENDANCISCHEHQYYLYDSGKWFCLCKAPMHCVYCHSGRIDSFDKDVAHEGLVLYPTRNHAERCQACHDEDYMSRVVTFASVAGISATPRPVIIATPVKVVEPPVKQPLPLLLLRLSQLEPWRLVGLCVLTIMLAGILIYSYRCWKADCRKTVQP